MPTWIDNYWEDPQKWAMDLAMQRAQGLEHFREGLKGDRVPSDQEADAPFDLHECNDCGIMIPTWRPICTLCEKWYEERGLSLPQFPLKARIPAMPEWLPSVPLIEDDNEVIA